MANLYNSAKEGVDITDVLSFPTVTNREFLALDPPLSGSVCIRFVPIHRKNWTDLLVSM